MRHRKAGRRLGRDSAHRKAMLRNMVTSLILHERINTTEAKAKELRSVAEKLVTLGKRGDLHARRQVAAFVANKEAVVKLFSDLSGRYKERNGGYTRVMKTGFRVGDNASMAIIELLPAVKAAVVEENVEDEKPKKKRASKKAVAEEVETVEE